MEQTAQLRTEIGELADAVTELAERTNVAEATARYNRRIVIGLIVSLALEFGLTAVLTYNNRQHSVYVNCQAEWSQAFAASARERAQAADTDRKAIDDMVTAVLNASTREQSRAALEHYRQARKEADAQRAANPAPALPDDVCH